jgi:hypothetical protein
MRQPPTFIVQRNTWSIATLVLDEFMPGAAAMQAGAASLQLFGAHAQLGVWRMHLFRGRVEV